MDSSDRISLMQKRAAVTMKHILYLNRMFTGFL